MHARYSLTTLALALGLMTAVVLVACAPESTAPETEQASPTATPEAAALQDVEPVDLGDYEVVENWPRPLPDDDLSHEGWTWGSASGVWAETPDKVWVGQRAEIQLPPGVPSFTCGCLLDPRRTNTGRRPYAGNPYDYEMRRHHIIFAVDREGNTIEEWLQHDEYLTPPRGSGLGEVGRGPHKILINPYDPEKHIWVVDDDMHEINVFTNDGTLVRTFGERGVPGRGPNNFNRPTDIVWLPDGTFFVADGYAGTRVAKFDADGNFLMDWGQPPEDRDNPGPNEFWSVHSIGISNDRRIFVADREHHRMQVFDENGEFLDMWPTGYDSAVLAHFVTQDDFVWVADWTTNRLIKYDLEGNYILDIGEPGPMPGQLDGVHQIHVDQEGNLYLSEIDNNRTQKFRPKPDADPARLIGPMVGGWPDSETTTQ